MLAISSFVFTFKCLLILFKDKEMPMIKYKKYIINIMDTQARFWHKLRSGKVECTACARKCKIPESGHGFCFVRKNIDGRLVLPAYGKINAMQIDPIEKKPFNHFMPGTYVLGIGTSSCNFGCMFCQNHNISKEHEISGVDVDPSHIVEIALENGVEGIAYTYNEPAIFIEYALDVAKIAHKKGLYNVFVTNGYLTSEVVGAMKGLIDAAVVDFKGNGAEKFANKYEMVASTEPIRQTLIELKKAGIHIEITDLIVPNVGDSLDECNKLTSWIHDNLGADTPVHFTQFHPDYKMLDYPITDYRTLLKHYEIARGNGLNYAYIGNIPNKYESTYCPECGKLVIGRENMHTTKWALNENNECKSCGAAIPITGSRPRRFRYEGIRALY